MKIILHDRRTKINSEMGFSIKSQLGGDSTLLNASQATNFNFKIEGGEFADFSCIRVGAEESLGRKIRCQWGIYGYQGKW
ncbi:MAG: HpaII family restriction endonuclease [Alloprevotella tannerae]|nr:HpaII family restriction endonuclease [Alloprevotella tannerae]